MMMVHALAEVRELSRQDVDRIPDISFARELARKLKKLLANIRNKNAAVFCQAIYIWDGVEVSFSQLPFASEPQAYVLRYDVWEEFLRFLSGFCRNLGYGTLTRKISKLRRKLDRRWGQSETKLFLCRRGVWKAGPAFITQGSYSEHKAKIRTIDHVFYWDGGKCGYFVFAKTRRELKMLLSLAV